jgi:hypothetical protein
MVKNIIISGQCIGSQEEIYEEFLKEQDHAAKVKTLEALVVTLKTCSSVVAVELEDENRYARIYYRGGHTQLVNIDIDSPLAMCMDIINRVK